MLSIPPDVQFVLSTCLLLSKCIYSVSFHQLKMFHTEKYVLQTENNSTGRHCIYAGQKFIFRIRELVSGKNITWPLVISFSPVGTRQKQPSTIRKAFCWEDTLGSLLAQVPPGKEMTSHGQGRKKKKPRDILGNLPSVSPFCFASVIPQQMGDEQAGDERIWQAHGELRKQRGKVLLTL